MCPAADDDRGAAASLGEHRVDMGDRGRQVGVGDEHVVAGRGQNTSLDGSTFAPVDAGVEHSDVAQTEQADHRHRAVGGTVVGHDDLKALPRPGQVGGGGGDRRNDALRLVVGGDNHADLGAVRSGFGFP